MHIELTDHLRCPREHPEAFLVLLPDRMDRRRVAAGHLGCPICGWGTAWTDFVPDFGDGWLSTGMLPFDAAAVQAMLGVDGPGGWIAWPVNCGMARSQKRRAEMFTSITLTSHGPGNRSQTSFAI